MLSVYLREGKIVRAYVEPLMLDNFVPYGVTGDLADSVLRQAAGEDPGPFVMESGAMEVDLKGRALQQSYTETVDGGAAPGKIIAVPESQWISNFKGSGRLLLDRDLLWVGGFENEMVSAPQVAPLWDLTTGNLQIGQDYAYDGEAGIRLARGAASTGDAVTTNMHRVLVNPGANLSITGMMRFNPGVLAQLQLSWYSTTSGSSFKKTIQPIEVQADGTWQSFRFDVQVPLKAVALGLYLRMKPPDKGTSSADFDDLRIIEWAGPAVLFSPLYNYARLTGAGDLTFTQQVLPGGEPWLMAPQARRIN